MSATYKVTGMTCGGCARSVESAIKSVAPDAKVTVDLGSAAVTVENASEDQVKKAVDEAGFTFLGAA
ncbi:MULTISPECIES: heavy-metal-associated domain-containing protein [Magnetospirillum]|uniref:Heavy metal transporter n=1 Tax=Magnetospirillum moscoviense TaxID=1437059 RepID=A0A178N106_9PROT|nr:MULTISPECIES: heavy-metal-associated domain-containing protein [Magnetospirillum]MBF0323589.1 heavy-metal-associated domain-containing protein [Alphaproteobacteria bacterium]OAN64487.1 heavy metal transporter [Magnetospirillum moscoviense]CAA7612040.1 Copper chaperone [Magnetospirillum sp. LM-5]